MSVLGCGICSSHPNNTSRPWKVLNFHFFAYSDPRPGGHFRAMSGAAAGWVFYTTFPAPDMARKRTLGKLTIEPVDVGGPKLTKAWLYYPMGIVPLLLVSSALSGLQVAIFWAAAGPPYVAGSARFRRPFAAPRPRAAQGELPAPWVI